MKAFRYRLEPVLNLREQSVERALEAFGLATQQRHAAEMIEGRAESDLLGLNRELLRMREADFRPSDQARFQQTVASAQARLAEAKDAVAHAREAEDVARQAYLDTRVEADTLERHRDHARNQFKRSRERADERELEEIVTARHHRAGEGGLW